MGYSGMGVWGTTPEPKTILFGIVQFKHHHPWYPKTPWLAYVVQLYGCLGRRPRTQAIFWGIVQPKHHRRGYLKTRLLAYGVQKFGCLGRHPRTQTIFLALCSSNTPILGTQKHVLWCMVCIGVCVWGATPIHPHASYPKTLFLADLVQSATPKTHIFWPCAFQTPVS